MTPHAKGTRGYVRETACLAPDDAAGTDACYSITATRKIVYRREEDQRGFRDPDRPSRFVRKGRIRTVIAILVAVLIVGVGGIMFRGRASNAEESNRGGNEELFNESVSLLALDLMSGNIRYDDLTTLALDCVAAVDANSPGADGVMVYPLELSSNVSGGFQVHGEQMWQGAGELRQFSLRLNVSNSEEAYAVELGSEIELDISFFVAASGNPYSCNTWAKKNVHHTAEVFEAASRSALRVGGTALYFSGSSTWQPIELMARESSGIPEWDSVFGDSRPLDDADWASRPATRLLIQQFFSLDARGG